MWESIACQVVHFESILKFKIFIKSIIHSLIRIVCIKTDAVANAAADDFMQYLCPSGFLMKALIEMIINQIANFMILNT